MRPLFCCTVLGQPGPARQAAANALVAGVPSSRDHNATRDVGDRQDFYPR